MENLNHYIIFCHVFLFINYIDASNYKTEKYVKLNHISGELESDSNSGLIRTITTRSTSMCALQCLNTASCRTIIVNPSLQICQTFDRILRKLTTPSPSPNATYYHVMIGENKVLFKNNLILLLCQLTFKIKRS